MPFVGSGWKEDIVLAYRTNTLSHRKAIKYIIEQTDDKKDDLLIDLINNLYDLDFGLFGDTV